MKKEEKENYIRKTYFWQCPYQAVIFYGYDRNGNEVYLLSQMGNDCYNQRTITLTQEELKVKTNL